ncbi:uncharacterized protein DS421_6g181290 [Arachis hypogaea]|nr:uncharacterized protein DS421_6g181290 [Arachis hypogaea]
MMNYLGSWMLTEITVPICALPPITQICNLRVKGDSEVKEKARSSWCRDGLAALEKGQKMNSFLL